VALAVWATQRSDPGFTEAITDFNFTGRNFSRLPLENNNVSIVKKRKKLNKERKERFGPTPKNKKHAPSKPQLGRPP
jgi:hypothetical protein